MTLVGIVVAVSSRGEEKHSLPRGFAQQVLMLLPFSEHAIKVGAIRRLV